MLQVRGKFCYIARYHEFFFRFDGTSFSPSKSTTYSHKRILSLGNYRGQPFTTGGETTTDTEILTISTDSWLSGTRYPYSNRLIYPRISYFAKF